MSPVPALSANSNAPAAADSARKTAPPVSEVLKKIGIIGAGQMGSGIATDEATFTLARGFVDRLGKTSVVAEDFPGFIVNRILLPMINEAVYALYEGVGNVEAIDTGMKLGANHPMGPLELADFIGLDAFTQARS